MGRRRNKKDEPSTVSETSAANPGTPKENELVRHPILPKWPTPAADVLIDEQRRLEAVAGSRKIDLRTWDLYQSVLKKVVAEHTRWQDDVVKAANRHRVEDGTEEADPKIKAGVPYGSEVTRPETPRPFWHLIIAFLLGVLTMWLIYKLST